MICPDCKAQIDDDAEVCPKCGMFILDDEEERLYAPKIFAVASVLFGAAAFGLFVGMLQIREMFVEFWLMGLLTAVLGLLFGLKGQKTPAKSLAVVGTVLNAAALVAAFVIGFG